MPTTRKRSTRSSSRRKSKKSTITTNTKTKSKKSGDEINVISILKEGVSEAMITPVGLFVICCYFTPLILELIQPIHPEVTFQMLPPYLFAWPVLLWCTVGLVTVFVTFRERQLSNNKVKLNANDKLAASWYFCCGFFFNSMMDVFAGQLQAWPMMSERYKQLEPRYLMPGRYEGITVLITSIQEILIQTPCGLLLFYGYYNQKSWTKPVEIIFNMWCIAGVAYYYGSEPLLGFPIVHSPAADGSDRFAFLTLYLFWFGFVIMPLLFAGVGVLLSIKAVKYISMKLEEEN